MNLEVGQVIGGYTIERRLGSGGMAAVYAATHNKLKRTVALKMMHAGLGDDADLLARFNREARIVARLDHPQIVPIYDFDEHNGAPYIVMKCITGRTLKWHLRKRVLPLDEINRVCSAVADALTYAHKHGVLHRDVKPANVLIDDNDGAPYLTDFGLARVVAHGESSMSVGMIVGTPHYLAPEQASGADDIGPAADVYALGVMMYEMVVGSVPFSGGSTHTVVHDHIYTPPPAPSRVNPEVPEDVERVLLRALEKSPHDRYATPRALLDDFHAAIQTSGLTDLSEDRSIVAARSIARLRQQDPQPIAAPVPPTADKPERGPDVLTEIEWDLGHILGNVDDALRDALPRNLNGFLNGAWNAVQRPFQDDSTQPYKPLTEQEIESQIRERVERRMQARRMWTVHLIIFSVMATLLLGVTFFSGDVVRGAVMAEVTTNAMDPLQADMIIAWATQPWVLVLILFWAGGLFAHRVHVRDLSAHREDKRLKRVLKRLSDAHGPDWADHITRGDYRKIEDTVRRRFAQVRAFRAHIAVFIFGNVALAFAWSFLERGFRYTAEYLRIVENNPADAGILLQIAAEPRFLAVSLVWLVVLIVHGVRTLLSRPNTAEDELDRERELTRSRQFPAAKPKRDAGAALADVPPVRLNDDGELTNSTVEAWENGAV